MANKREFAHHMLREIHEQPRTVRDTLAGRLDPDSGLVALETLLLTDAELKSLAWIRIVASGTSRYAGLVGKYMIEDLAGIPVDVDYASELECRRLSSSAPPLTIVTSQSGETADTLAALRRAKREGSKTVAICNVENSSIMREADFALQIQAGPELSVPSTKAFGGQLTCLFLLALCLAQARQSRPRRELSDYALEATRIPEKLDAVLQLERHCAEIAERYSRSPDFIFFGRGPHYPIALDGALKLKEAAYIHAEGYPGGEFKHGQITQLTMKSSGQMVEGPAWYSALLGLGYARQGKVAEARSILSPAASIARRKGDKELLAQLIYFQGVAESNPTRGDPQKAIEFGEQAIAISKELGDEQLTKENQRIIGAAANRLGRSEIKERNSEKAAKYFSLQLQLGTELNDKDNMAQGLEGLGVAELFTTSRRHDLNLAVKYLDQAAALGHEIANPTREGTARYYSSIAAEALGDTARAIADAEVAVLLLNHLNVSQKDRAADHLASLRAKASAGGKRLEVGIPAELLELLRLPLPLTRGEYLALGTGNVVTVQQFWAADLAIIRGANGGSRMAQFEKLRPDVKTKHKQMQDLHQAVVAM